MSKYILSIDQSTQGTKALLLDESGILICRADLPHRQIINDLGWVEHDPREIICNTVQAAKNVVEKAGIHKEDIVALGLSNQRETSVVWDRTNGKPVYNAIVWQCVRGAAICEELKQKGFASQIQKTTGIQLSPYFPAAKISWIMRNVDGVAERSKRGEICVGTIDSWLVYNLSIDHRHYTDYSNASRTQLFNINTLQWDNTLLKLFCIDLNSMATVVDSDGYFGETDLEGWLDRPIPICAVLGDSHSALLGQGCLKPGMAKCTYGTGSSVMMNIGEKPVFSDKGVVTSLAWKLGGKVNYVLEGNVNYTGAVITWLKENLKLIDDPSETEALARAANSGDRCYLIPAFSGLGAPYWDSDARAAIVGMNRTTGKNEIVRAALDCIAFQITDIVEAMSESISTKMIELRVDGGPTKNKYLMQLQSDLLGIPVRIPDSEELSGIGAAYAAGCSCGLYDETIFSVIKRTSYTPGIDASVRNKMCAGWRAAVKCVRE